MKKKAFILCAGASTRWRNKDKPKGTPQIKQNIIINNEKLIDRTIRLLKENNINDITIVLRGDILQNKDCKYIDLGSAEKASTVMDTLKTKEHWENNIIILLGDVYFSENAIKTIVKNKDKIPTFYGRPFKSFVTGKTRPEIFAFSFDSKDANKIEKSILSAIKMVANMVVARLTKDPHVRMWQLYEHYHKQPLGDVFSYGAEKRDIINKDGFIVIDDETDDFDVYQDYINYMENTKNNNG